MKPRRRLLTALLLLLAAAGLTARFLSKAATGIGGRSLRYRVAAVQINFMDPENMRQLGVALLEQGDVERGIAWLEQSLQKGPLSPQTWVELGRAHLTNLEQRKHHFELGIAELRTAARLGPGRPELSLSVGLELLRLWPLLDNEAQEECRQRLSRGISHMGPEKVNSMIGDWYHYSRSWELLAGVLKSCPNSCKQVGERLLQLGAPLEWRWRLLEASERRHYAEIRTQYNELERRGVSIAELKSLIQKMERLRGYARLLNPQDMDWIRYRNFHEDLLYRVLEQSLRDYKRKPENQLRMDIMDQLERVIQQTHRVDLADLPRLLEELDIWRPGEPNSLIMRIRLDLRIGDHAAALERAQQLLPSLKAEPAALEVGLLAVRAAIAVRLMTMALQQIENILHHHPENLEALWRRMQINRFLREDVSQQDIEYLQNESILEIAHKGQTSARVPLVEGVHAGVKIPASSDSKNRLLQVYLDGAILLETYLGAEPRIIWLDVPVPEDVEPMPKLEAKIVVIQPSEE